MRTTRVAIGLGAFVVVLLSLLAPAARAVEPDGADGAALRPGACDGVHEATSSPVDDLPISQALLRRCLRLNQLQVLGTHNSFRQAVTPQILDVLRTFDPAEADSLEYAHTPLPEQFEHEAIRQIELDVYADPEGGLFAGRPALTALGLPNVTPPALLEPGFKALHSPDTDFNSSCLTFVDCLRQVKGWSATHPGHLPIAVLVELKEGATLDPFGLGFAIPVPVLGPELDALDAEIRSVFSENQVITPDDVRGAHATLEAAVLADGWPTLKQSTGQVLFLMDNGGPKRDLYRAGRPSLEGRVLFTNAVPGSPDAAFVKVNSPEGNQAAIQGLVAQGYVVRTRSDVPTIQARNGDTTQREAALASGAQWVSTDYPVAGRSIWSDYVATIPDGAPARCNPVNTGPRCRSELVERLRHRHP